MGSHFLCATLYIHVCMKITYIHVRLYVCVQTYIHNIHVGHNVHSSIHTHNFYRLLIRIHIYPSSHCSAAPLGVQCLHTSSRGEFPGYWDWLWCPRLPSVIVIVIVNSKLLKRLLKAKRRAPAYSRALRQIRGVFQRIVRGRLWSVFQRVRECVKSEVFSKE